MFYWTCQPGLETLENGFYNYKLYQVIIPHVPKGVGDQNDQTSRALAA